MAGEIQLNSTTFATESGGTITVSNVDSATNRQNLGLEIGVDVQSYDADTTKNDVANTFTANQIISVTDNTNAALRVTQLGTGNALVVEDETNPDSTSFVVDSSGNVGVGLANPGSKLSVSGSTSLDGAVVVNESGADVDFRVESDTNENALFVDGATGNVFVGTDNIDVTLDNEEGTVFLAEGAIRTSRENGASHFNRKGGNGSIILCQKDGSTVGSINVNDSSTVYDTASDYRLKEDWVPISDSIARVKALNPVNFAWKIDGTRVDGFLAHEAAEVVPEAVSGEKDAVDADGNPEYQGIDYGRITPLLTSALQDAIEKIEMLERRIAELEAQ